MHIFEKIHIQGFRRLHDIELKLKPLNVMIGANGSGKTSILDVFTLLSASASGDLQQTLSEFGGVDANRAAFNSSTAHTLQFELEKAAHLGEPLKYRIVIQPEGVSYRILTEALTQHRKPQLPEPHKYIETLYSSVRYFDPDLNQLRAPTWEHLPLESALSQVPKMYQEPEQFRKNLASCVHYHALDVSQRAPVRLPQPMREAKLPGQNGEDLVSCLYWMREANPTQFELIENALKVSFPRFERLNFPPVAAGTLAMTWKETSSKQPFFMHQLSEGTLRFLWLVTLLYSPGLTEVTLIDEPEVSLHPELLAVLAECMREASQHTQLIVATHADRLVRFLAPEEVITLDVEAEGVATAVWADELDLAVWLDEYTLDEVWQHGFMGARP